MVLILCPNLCLDRVIVVPGFSPGRIHRGESGVTLASGKGLNVARAVRALGEQATVIGLVGSDDNGRAIVQGARTCGISLRAVRVEGPTRVCTLIIDPGNAETVINEPGPEAGGGIDQQLLAHLRAGLRRARVLVLAGSVPAALPQNFYARAIELSREVKRVPAILDAAGAPLRLGLLAQPNLIKVNRTEMADVLARPLASVDEVLDAADTLRTQTRGEVIVTMGASGAALITAEGRWHLSPPEVTRVNTIGAGDSLTAGVIVGLLRGYSLLDAARTGVAAAAADVTTLLPGTIDAEQVGALLPQVAIRASAR
ncbi:MAG: hypothetical protein E6H01_06490 [Bacillati bacterium ANGP1]|uniref:Carbohydrate kinase PfkB domain-containing protein n=1 Tax=Candidatus Segetimicrobium genomatis TaxID=2569760 RepID=A0A537L411_9BACT|nr:MAG: hypothetical protein E6H01_06490 [Terrabacteria group bacterium ANGP1]